MAPLLLLGRLPPLMMEEVRLVWELLGGREELKEDGEGELGEEGATGVVMGTRPEPYLDLELARFCGRSGGCRALVLRCKRLGVGSGNSGGWRHTAGAAGGGGCSGGGTVCSCV
jgi:hypothetical protein